MKEGWVWLGMGLAVAVGIYIVVRDRASGSLGQTEFPPEFWDSVRRAPTDTSVERVKQIFHEAMRQRETKTGTRTA